MIRKDNLMDWKQIESNWAAMAQRIRADVQCGKTADGVALQRRIIKVEVGKSVVAKQVVSVNTEIAAKRKQVSTF